MHFSIPPNAEMEVISLAADWQDGIRMAKNGQDFHSTGYLGSGSAKQVVYVLS